MLRIYIDADACPVKDEVYRVAKRYGLRVSVVSNGGMRVPDWVEMVVVPPATMIVDDWIVEHVGAHDIVVTSDIPLAARCLEKEARVLSPKGHAFTDDTIGEALATRALMDELRQMGSVKGGPAPMSKQDRSRFLSRLDETITALQRLTGRKDARGSEPGDKQAGQESEPGRA